MNLYRAIIEQMFEREDFVFELEAKDDNEAIAIVDKKAENLHSVTKKKLYLIGKRVK